MGQQSARCLNVEINSLLKMKGNLFHRKQSGSYRNLCKTLLMSTTAIVVDIYITLAYHIITFYASES